MAQPAEHGRASPARLAVESVSVVVCTWSDDRWDALVSAVASVHRQTRPPDEMVVVVDHNATLLARARASFEGVLVVPNDLGRGLSGARNSGVGASSAEVVAFLDDDAVAAPDWLERLVEAYDEGVGGVGGWIGPNWIGGRPRWFPQEFDWVVGCTYRGFPESPGPVRNPIGANMSFRRDLLERAGLFRSGLGRVGGRPVGCEETEFCIRAGRRVPGTRFLYEPTSRVSHVVAPARATGRYFLSRCYAEGSSKALVRRLAGSADALGVERTYTLRTLPRALATGVGDGLRGDLTGFARAAAIVAGLVAAALGYVVASRPHGRRTNSGVATETAGRRLRHLDWRFLLPGGEPGSAVVFGDDAIAHDLAAVVPDVAVAPGAPASRDLAVVADPDQEMLGAAFHALKPGGLCYCEWRRPVPGGWKHAARLLRAAGFADVTCYWRWPGRRGAVPSLWVPLGDRRIADYIVAGELLSRPRTVRRLLGTVWRAAFRARLLLPVIATASRPAGPMGDRPGPAGVLAALRAEWPESVAGQRPRQLQWLLLAPGEHALKKVIGLVFADLEPRPRLVVKMARTREAEAALRREAGSLRALAASAPALRGAPALLSVVDRPGLPLVLAETAVEGSQVAPMLTGDTYAAHAGVVTDWLIELAGHRRRGPSGRETVADLLADVVPGDGEASLHDLLRPLDALPAVFEHRDFAPWNLRVVDGRLGVLDWESAEPHGFPALDLVYFLAFAAFLIDGAIDSGTSRSSYLATFHGRGNRADAALASQHLYAHALGLPIESLRPLRALTWLVHARNARSRPADDSAREGLDARFFLELLDAELAASEAS